MTQTTAIDPAVEAADRGFCIAALPKVSRTFALSIEALPDFPELAPPVPSVDPDTQEVSFDLAS